MSSLPNTSAQSGSGGLSLTAARRFCPTSIALHWLSAVLVLLAFALGWLRLGLDDELGWNKTLLLVHRQVGLTVMVLLVGRLVMRWRARAASNTCGPTTPLAALLLRVLHGLAGASHAVLYLLLAALPLLGWAMSSARGYPVSLWGVLPLPSLMSIDPDWADALQEWHKLAGQLLLGMVLLHALAALFHHFVLKDAVLAEMLPPSLRLRRR